MDSSCTVLCVDERFHKCSIRTLFVRNRVCCRRKKTGLVLFITDYNEIVAMEYVNSDLVNTLGNLLGRCTATSINPQQIYPRKHEDTYLSKITASDRETFENIDVLVGKYL